MNKQQRWNQAQEYELNWWKKRHKVIDLSYLSRFADELKSDLKDTVIFDQELRVLEIGSGPAGIITHLPGKYRVGIDPLEDFYKSVPEYSAYRNSEVKYSNSKGENLEFDDSSFDLVIIDNVLDHCEDPNKVISEVSRVLTAEGVIYFKQNIYHKVGKIIRNILEYFTFDKGHPYNFTLVDIQKLFLKHNFRTKVLKQRGHIKQLLVELKMKNMKALIRLLTLMTRDKVTMTCHKKN